MSIDVAIQVHCASGEVSFVPPSLPAQTVQRDVFATKEVMRLIGDGDGSNSTLEIVGGKARAKIDSFTTGKIFVFGMDPQNKSVTCLIARNAPVATGILDVRISDPQPAVRIFGCAIKQDAIVLLTFALRKGLSFSREVRRARAEWNRLFPSHDPFISSHYEEYFSNVIPG